MRTKTCTKCKRKLPATAEYFYRDKTCKKGIGKICKACKSKYAAKWVKQDRKKFPEKYSIRSKKYRANNPEKVKAKSLRNRLSLRYGLTPEEKKKMFDDQNGCCAICGRHQTEIKETIGVDHNHQTNQVRGLLCNRCNLFVDYVEKYPNLIEPCFEYLERWNKDAR